MNKRMARQIEIIADNLEEKNRKLMPGRRRRTAYDLVVMNAALGIRCGIDDLEEFREHLMVGVGRGEYTEKHVDKMMVALFDECLTAKINDEVT